MSDIAAIAASNVAKVMAFLKTSNLLTPVTLKTSPVVGSYDATTDTTPVTWTETAAHGLLFAATAKDLAPGNNDEYEAFLAGRFKKALLEMAALPAAPSVDSKLVHGADTWSVRSVEIDPTNSVAILTLIR